MTADIIIQISDRCLAAVHDSRRWVLQSSGGDTWVVRQFDSSQSSLCHSCGEIKGLLHTGDEADCRAFFKSLALRLRAIRWDSRESDFVTGSQYKRTPGVQRGDDEYQA